MKKKRITGHFHKLKPKTPAYRKPIFWILISAGVIAIIVIYFLLFWQFIFVKNIKISGNSEIKTEDIQKVVDRGVDHNFLFFHSKSIVLFPLNKVSQNILSSFPKIDSVMIQKKFPDTIIVNITERQPAVVLCGYEGDKATQCYFSDSNGIIYEEALPTISGFPIMRQFNQTDFKLGFQTIDKRFIDYANSLKKSIEDITFEKINILSTDEMEIKSQEGWVVYFNLLADVNLQITKLKLLIDTNFITADSRKNLQYIDLRFGDKAYYK